MTSLRIAVIPGDGIGPEVTAEALKVLEVAAPAEVKFEQTRYDLGAERYLATGEVLPDSVLAEIRDMDDGPLVVVLASHVEPSYAVRAVAAGAHGYVSQSDAPEQLDG